MLSWADSKLYLMARLLFWRPRECGVPPSLPLLPSPRSPGVVVPVRVSFTSQVDQSNIYLRAVCKKSLEVKWLYILLCITNNSNKHQSFIYAQLNDQTVLLLKIQFSISHLFVLSLNVK